MEKSFIKDSDSSRVKACRCSPIVFGLFLLSFFSVVPPPHLAQTEDGRKPGSWNNPLSRVLTLKKDDRASKEKG